MTQGTISFETLVGMLPGLEEPPLVEAQYAAFEVAPTVLPQFIAPTFEVMEWPTNAAVLLVEAPGAVGKTVTGEALAATLKWPLIRAEKAQVGSYSLSGIVTDALGFGDYLARVRDSSAGLIIDSLDEAHLKAGSSNFLAFLQNIMSVGRRREQPTQPSIVLLSRSDTAELVQLAFADAQVPIAHVRLSFFNYDAAIAYVKSYQSSRAGITGQPQYQVALNSPQPFAHLLDLRIRQLMRVLTGNEVTDIRQEWSHCDEFLGYAPVLTVLAESVACTNPALEISSLKSSGPQSQRRILADICESILQREQEKLATNFRAKLQSYLPANDPTNLEELSLYSSEEQLIRISSVVLGIPLASSLPAALPTVLHPLYDEAVQQFVLDHPFIRNKAFSSAVFQDYTHAAISNSLSAKAALSADPTAVITRVGAFFCEFYQSLAGAGVPVIPEALVAPIAESWQLSRDLVGARNSHVVVVLREEGGLLQLTALDGDSRNEQNDVDRFEITDVSGVFCMPSMPSNWTVISNQGVVLGERNRALSVGSGCVIAGAEIDIQADGIISSAWPNSPVSMIGAPVVRGDYLSTYSISKDQLHIYSDQVPLILHPLRRQLPAELEFVRFSDYVDLRAILLAFKRTVHLGLCASRSIIDKLVGDGTYRNLLVARLQDLGVLERKDEWYLLRPENLVQVGFSLQDLKSGQPGSVVLKFLAECRRGTEDLGRGGTSV